MNKITKEREKESDRLSDQFVNELLMNALRLYQEEPDEFLSRISLEENSNTEIDKQMFTEDPLYHMCEEWLIEHSN